MALPLRPCSLVLRTLVVWTLILCAGSAPATKPTRMPRRRPPPAATTQAVTQVPGVSAQQQAREKIRAIYASDYALETYASRRALARKLIEQGDATQRDVDVKYVFYVEARDVAAKVGDIPTALDAVDHLISAFPLLKLPHRLEVMNQAVPAINNAQAGAAATSMCIDLADQAIVDGDYVRADEFLSLAAQAAEKTGKPVYGSWVRSRAVRIDALKSAYEIAKPAETKLKTSANDPRANEVFGRYTCLVRDEWDIGLTMLAIGADQTLAGIADRDLSCPDDDAAEQLEVANLWWRYAIAVITPESPRWKARAAFWYRKALAGADGLDKALAQQRILEVSPPPDPKKKPPRPPDAIAFNGRTYRVCIAEVTWEQARTLCEGAGGRLACMETRVESEAVAKIARGRSLWVGATCGEKGKWSWISGAEMFFTYWGSDEPSQSTAEVHVALGSNGAWKTSTSKHGFICEWAD